MLESLVQSMQPKERKRIVDALTRFTEALAELAELGVKLAREEAARVARKERPH